MHLGFKPGNGVADGGIPATVSATGQALTFVQFQCNLLDETKGLGDKIESFTKATGIKKVVDSVSQGLNIPCGCQQRKETLNKMFPGK